MQALSAYHMKKPQVMVKQNVFIFFPIFILNRTSNVTLSMAHFGGENILDH